MNFDQPSTGSSLKSKLISTAILILVIFLVIYFWHRLRNDYNNLYGNSPWILSGTKTANTRSVVPGHIIRRSVDSAYGTEFSYSFWMYINNWATNEGKWKHIMHKGNESGVPLQAPGFWLHPNENTLRIHMNTFENPEESFDIGNIPIHKWVHVTVVLMGKDLDVYINGRLKSRFQLSSVPKQNYGDLYVNQWNGFDGFMSRVRYYNYAVPIYYIEKMVNDGPSGAKCIDTGSEVPPYLRDDYWMNTGFPEIRPRKSD